MRRHLLERGLALAVGLDITYGFLNAGVIVICLHFVSVFSSSKITTFTSIGKAVSCSVINIAVRYNVREGKILLADKIIYLAVDRPSTRSKIIYLAVELRQLGEAENHIVEKECSEREITGRAAALSGRMPNKAKLKVIRDASDS
jgi:hypothetical protein